MYILYRSVTIWRNRNRRRRQWQQLWALLYLLDPLPHSPRHLKV